MPCCAVTLSRVNPARHNNSRESGQNHFHRLEPEPVMTGPDPAGKHANIVRQSLPATISGWPAG
jgi:hypothetical protein